jgi:hypothetical protein
VTSASRCSSSAKKEVHLAPRPSREIGAVSCVPNQLVRLHDVFQHVSQQVVGPACSGRAEAGRT